MKKRLKLEEHQIESIVEGLGLALATDKIMVDGEKVGFMHREQPNDANDSGWRFFSGSESEDYLNQPKHLGHYDVNVIANYDRDIVPHLNAPVGSAFERAGDSFVETLAELP
jgi:hypothetical protein